MVPFFRGSGINALIFELYFGAFMKEKIDGLIKDGLLYFIGNKLPDDFYAAFIEWTNIANTTNDPKAHYNIAYCYNVGEGTQPDIERAKNHYMLALEGGVKAAGLRLLRMQRKATLKLPEKLQLFNNRNLSREEAMQHVASLNALIALVDELINKGCDELKSAGEQFFILATLLELHALYRSGDVSAYKALCQARISQGYEWALPLLKIRECRVETDIAYSARKDIVGQGVTRGNTVHYHGDKYYLVSSFAKFINSSDTELVVFDRAQGRTDVPAGKTLDFHDPRVGDKVHSLPDTFNTDRTRFVEVFPFRRNPPPLTETTVKELQCGFDLPEKATMTVTELPVSGGGGGGGAFGKIVLLAIVAVVLFVAWQIMSSSGYR